jgi:hypothetical protein
MNNSVILYCSTLENQLPVRYQKYVSLSCSMLSIPETHYVIFTGMAKPYQFTVPAMFTNSNSFTV